MKETLLPESNMDNNAAILAQKTISTIFLLTEKCQLWEHFKAADKLSGIIGTALIQHPNAQVRHTMANVIDKFCRDAQSTAISQSRIAFFWKMIQTDLLPRAKDFPEQARALLELANNIFRYLASKHPDSVDVTMLFRDWTNEIKGYYFAEPLSTVYEDFLFSGYVQLAQQCVRFANNMGIVLQPGDLVATIFWKFLFTEYSDESELARVGQKFPVISTLARVELYRLLLVIAAFTTGYQELLELILQLFPTGIFFPLHLAFMIANQWKQTTSLRMDGTLTETDGLPLLLGTSA